MEPQQSEPNRSSSSHLRSVAFWHPPGLTIGGVQVSECQYIARNEHVLGVMMTDQEKRRDYTEGFGLQVAAANADYGGYQSEPIPGGESRDVV